MSVASSALDPRTPVIVGVGQVNQRVDEGAEPLEPVALMAEAVRRAAADAGHDGLGARASSVRVVSVLSWRYRDPGALLAEQLGATPDETVGTTAGGNSPQLLVNATALDIAAGHADLVLVAGAEAWRTRMETRREGTRPDWTVQDEALAPSRTLGSETAMSHPAEMARGIMMPVQVYPLFEQALRATAGRGVDEHRRRIAELWAGFSEVAAKNPHAWVQQAFSADELRTASVENRMIGFPYTKRLNANNSVEQGAALVLCSVERARALGVPTDRWVFPLSGTDANDTPFVSNRADLHSSPAIRAAGRAALDLAEVGVDDLAHIDLYSCFPSAVEVAADELGLGLDRQLTVTGGLSFAGGPWNNYVTHSIATMVGRLREDPGSVGLCTANGGYLTKHAMGVYSTAPLVGGFRYAQPQDQVDAVDGREVADRWEGPATVESYTVMHDRDGAPANGIIAALCPDGRRTWATTEDPDTLIAMEHAELVGRATTTAADGTAAIS